MEYHLSPSILAADFNKLGEEIAAVESSGCRWLHVDVMDGQFVPSISLGMPVIASIRKISSLFFDVHLMVQEPERYVREFAACGADLITVHAEACTHLNRTLQVIRECGCKAGVALNPATPLCALDYCLDQIDLILVMTVNPGFGGQKYIQSSTEKIRTLRSRLNQIGREVYIEVDGGINNSTAEIVLEAGANVLVAGSAVFGGDIRKNVEMFEAHLNKYRQE